MNYADIKKIDVANGEGVRVSVFVSGCNHHCKGCFNAQAWDFNYGKEFTEEDIERIINELDHPYVSGLSLLGGEPLEYSNQKGLLPLLRKVKEKYPNKTIWCYTGYIFDEEIMNKMYKENNYTREFLSLIDVLVDGRFEEELLNRTLYFRGSSNQRIIDVQKSLSKREIIELDFDREGERVHA